MQVDVNTRRNKGAIIFHTLLRLFSNRSNGTRSYTKILRSQLFLLPVPTCDLTKHLMYSFIGCYLEMVYWWCGFVCKTFLVILSYRPSYIEASTLLKYVPTFNVNNFLLTTSIRLKIQISSVRNPKLTKESKPSMWFVRSMKVKAWVDGRAVPLAGPSSGLQNTKRWHTARLLTLATF